MSLVVKKLKTDVQESFITKLYSDINNLKDELTNIGSSIDSLESSAIEATQDHQKFDFGKVDDGVKIVEKINEGIAILEARLVILDDRDITQKIDDTMEALDNYDREVRGITYKVKDELEELEKLVKSDKRHS